MSPCVTEPRVREALNREGAAGTETHANSVSPRPRGGGAWAGRWRPLRPAGSLSGRGAQARVSEVRPRCCSLRSCVLTPPAGAAWDPACLAHNKAPNHPPTPSPGLGR